MKRWMTLLVTLCLCLAALPAMAMETLYLAPTVSDITLGEGETLEDTEDGQTYRFMLEEYLQCVTFYGEDGALTGYAFVSTAYAEGGFYPYIRFDATGMVIEDESADQFPEGSLPRVIVGKRPPLVIPTADVESAPKAIINIVNMPDIPVPAPKLEQSAEKWTLSGVMIEGAQVFRGEMRYTPLDGTMVACAMNYVNDSDILTWDNPQEIAAYQALLDEGKLDEERTQIFIQYSGLTSWYSKDARMHTQFFLSSGSATTAYSDPPLYVFRESDGGGEWRVDLRGENNQILWTAWYDADGQLTGVSAQ